MKTKQIRTFARFSEVNGFVLVKNFAAIQVKIKIKKKNTFKKESFNNVKCQKRQASIT